VEDLASGPGELTIAMGITSKQDGADLAEGPLHLLRPLDEAPFEIDVTPRIGIRHSAELPLRFAIAGNRFVSR
jgi:DNA-3-methyladenine glycosylase